MTAQTTNPSTFVSPASDASGGSPGLLARVLSTTGDPGALVARVALGLVMFPHGAQKALGWFGGYGFTGTMGFFTGKMGIPAAFAALAILAEFLGSIGLVVGAVSRVAALGIAAIMTVAIATVHLHNGFFMNWYGSQAGEGFEYHLLAIALALVVMIKGGGAYSVDRAVTARRWRQVW